MEPIPSLATDQRSATISEIQRCQDSHAGRAAGSSRCWWASSAGRSDSTSDSSAAAWCPTSWTRDEAMPWPTMRSRGHPDQGDRVLAAAGQAGPGPPDRRPGTAGQVADQRRRVEEAAGQPQRVGRQHVQPGKPHARPVLAALGDRLGEQVELREHLVEGESDDREPPLLLARRLLDPVALEPLQVAVHPVAQRATALDQEPVDRGQRSRRRRRRRDHGLVDHERADLSQPGEECARLLLEEGGCRGLGHRALRRP